MQPLYFLHGKELPRLRPGNLKLSSIILVFFLVWLAIRFFLPLFSPFLLGTLLALAAEPLVKFLHRTLRIPRSISAGIGVTMAFALLSMLLLSLFALALRELGGLSRVLPDLGETAKNGFSLVRNWLLQLSSHTPESIRPVLRQNVDRFFSDSAAFLDKGIGYLLGLAGSLLTHVPDSALSLGTAVISAFLISARLPILRRYLLRRIPTEWIRSFRDTACQLRRILGSWFTAQCKLTGVSFLLCFLGLVILRIPYAFGWALGICLVDAFPVLGTGTVLLPWSLICMLQEDTPRAVGLASTYVAITLTRSMLEPKLLGKHLGLDPLVTLIALYTGFRLWGIGGMLLAPVLTVAAMQLSAFRNNRG